MKISLRLTSNIFENMILWRVRSNAFDISVAQVKTSLALMRK